MQLPVISWNADNSAFVEQSAGSGDRLQIQLAPTIKHQVAAMLTLLQRYGWNYFSIVTGMIAGHRNFEQVCKTESYQFSWISCQLKVTRSNPWLVVIS